MKANEIQISDRLYSIIDRDDHTEKKLCKVTGIRTDCDVPLIQCDDTDVWYPLDSYEPIPLTPEILEKNGFNPYIPEGHLETVYACQDVSKAVADELYALWPYPDGSFYLLLRVDGKDMVRMDVRYVHQLQHALRLCGISKEIIL